MRKSLFIYIKEYIREKHTLIIIIVNILFLFVSNLVFAMYENEEKLKASTSHTISHSSNALIEDREAPTLTIGTDEGIEVNTSSLLPASPSNILIEDRENPAFAIEVVNVIEITPNILIGDRETPPLTIETDEETRRRLAQAISERYNRYTENPPPRFSLLRELPPLIGVLSGLPYSKFALQETEDSLFLKAYFSDSTIAFLKDYFAASTIVSIGLSRVWTLDALFNEVWRGSSKKIYTHAIVNILSFFSALPLTYTIWNNEHSILYTSIIFVSEWSLAALGFYEIFEEIGVQHSCLNRNLETIADQQSPSLENLNLPIRQFFRFLLSRSNPDVFADELCSSLGEEHAPRYIELAEMPKSAPKIIAKGLFYVIPVASLIVNSVLAYKNTEEITSSPFIVIPYIALTALPSFALELYTTSSSVDDLWGDTINKRSYFKAKSRILFYLLGGLSLAISTGSSIWGVGIVSSVFEGSFLESAVPFFMFTTVTQLIIFESHGARDYIAKKYFHYKDVKGSDQEKKTTTLVKILGEINEAATGTSSKDDYAWYNPLGWCRKVYSLLSSTCRSRSSEENEREVTSEDRDEFSSTEEYLEE